MAWPPQIPPGSKAMREFWAALVTKIAETTPIDGIGIFVEDAPNGKSINAGIKSGSSGGTTASHPWKAEITTGESETQIVSVLEGFIYPSLDNPVPLDFTAMGLTFPAYTGAVEIGSKVLLRIDYDSEDLGDITAEGVLCYLQTTTDEWSEIDLQEWEDDIESDDYRKQTIARIPICEIVEATDSEGEGTGALAVRQIAFVHWWMSKTIFNGRIADWPGTI